MFRATLAAFVLALTPSLERRTGEPPGPLTVVDSDEYFALELSSPPDANGKSSAPRTVGVARWTRRAGPSTLLELEARFFDEHARVHHVERIGEDASELVWREWRAGQGRTLNARLAKGALELVEWGRLQAHRQTWKAPPELVFPLQAVELARADGAASNWGAGTFARFDPLGRNIEPTTLKRLRENEIERVAFDGLDGESVGTFAFEAGALRWFRWQNGDLRARAVDAGEHARLQHAYERSIAER